MFDADMSIGGKKSLSDRIVCLDELVPTEIMSGFPNLIGLPVQTIPIFLASMINQQLPPVYLDSVENYGVPADVCPLPSAEAGVAIEGDYPIFGKCFISCNMPCDGSVMTSEYQDRDFKAADIRAGRTAEIQRRCRRAGLRGRGDHGLHRIHRAGRRGRSSTGTPFIRAWRTATRSRASISTCGR